MRVPDEGIVHILEDITSPVVMDSVLA